MQRYLIFADFIKRKSAMEPSVIQLNDESLRASEANVWLNVDMIKLNFWLLQKEDAAIICKVFYAENWKRNNNKRWCFSSKRDEGFASDVRFMHLWSRSQRHAHVSSTTYQVAGWIATKDVLLRDMWSDLRCGWETLTPSCPLILLPRIDWIA